MSTYRDLGVGLTSQARVEAVRSLRGLWLAREVPFPADMGDRIYSGNLAKALADAGTDLTFVGLQSESNHPPPTDWPLKWSTVADHRRGAIRALISTMPSVAASFATAAYRRHVHSLARERWDFIVIDQLALGWALEVVQSAFAHGERPVLVHVAHNHESSLWESFYREFDGLILKRLVLWQNYVKTRAFERMIASRADLVTVITEEDAAKFSQDVPGIRTIVLKPGFNGVVSSRAVISAETPRRVVLLGSFRWSAKQENLRQFVKIADPIFAKRGIEFLVVGPIPENIAGELERTSSATRFAGFVEELQPVLDTARIAVVPEAIGGGFKLKFLDYVFGRMPVATLARATAGLPDEIRQAMLCTDTLSQLALGIADLIDNLAELNAMQERALRYGTELFRWSDRGDDLLSAIHECARNIRTAGPHDPVAS
jgi:glycosyltransferase involved in cell wall biosynthesis